jgi:hypothetical protein
MLVDKAPGLFDSFAVVSANECFKSYEMFVVPDDVRAVICHPKSHYRMVGSYAFYLGLVKRDHQGSVRMERGLYPSNLFGADTDEIERIPALVRHL